MHQEDNRQSRRSHGGTQESKRSQDPRIREHEYALPEMNQDLQKKLVSKGNLF